MYAPFFVLISMRAKQSEVFSLGKAEPAYLWGKAYKKIQKFIIELQSRNGIVTAEG